MTRLSVRQGVVIAALMAGLIFTASSGGKTDRWNEPEHFLEYDTEAGLFRLAAASPSEGGDEPDRRVTAHDVKAALLYHFTKFVTWPPEVISENRLSLCVFGENSVLASLQKSVEGKKIGGNSIIVKSFTSVEELEFCHLLFIGAEEEDRMVRTLMKVKDWSTLSVNESEEFLRLGGMINFSVSGSKVRFSINEAAIKRARLEIAPALLKLAQ